MMSAGDIGVASKDHTSSMEYKSVPNYSQQPSSRSSASNSPPTTLQTGNQKEQINAKENSKSLQPTPVLTSNSLARPASSGELLGIQLQSKESSRGHNHVLGNTTHVKLDKSSGSAAGALLAKEIKVEPQTSELPNVKRDNKDARTDRPPSVTSSRDAKGSERPASRLSYHGKEGKDKKNHAAAVQNSDDSELDSADEMHESGSRPGTGGSGGKRQSTIDWEMMEGLREGQKFEGQRPTKYEGFILKRRKWPMKGWHKRHFVLERGLLKYGKNHAEVSKGRIHGSLDTGLSVVTYKKKTGQIDIDADDTIFHLKVKSKVSFDSWVSALRNHRLYRQHELSYGSSDVPRLTTLTSTEDSVVSPITSKAISDGVFGMHVNGTPRERRSSGYGDRQLNFHRAGSLKDRTPGKLAAWLYDVPGIDKLNRDLAECQERMFELTALTGILRSLPNVLPSDSSLYELSDSPRKDKTKRGWRKKERKSQELTVTTVATNGDKSIHGSTSNPAIMLTDQVAAHVAGDGGSDTRRDLKLFEDFVEKAKTVHDCLKTLSHTISTERDRLRHSLENEDVTLVASGPLAVQQLQSALLETRKQNVELRARLQKIGDLASTDNHSFINSHSSTNDNVFTNQHNELSQGIDLAQSPSRLHGLALSVSTESVSEFYDAAQSLHSSDSSEGSEEDQDQEAISDVSDTETVSTNNRDDESQIIPKMFTGRRTILPSPKPDTGDVSLLSLLYKNIGKDLSKISMPITMNEPLSMLQRLCEELEYTELIDQAAEVDDPIQRMILIAAFSVSPYAAQRYRAGTKPFNPIMGETYECSREDKGWKFVAEQVSHHPPISAAYCESKNFVFWQDMRIKTKFWGKSMEIQPIGNVNLKIPKYNDHYRWNKATSCVHNLLGGQRWVDIYGEVIITNVANNIQCKLTYPKSGYWSDRRQEVYGTILDANGVIRQHIFGKWNEGLYCGPHSVSRAASARSIWRPGAMSEDCELYYGFSRFAIELNEIDPDQVSLYAPTDSRFRPDQRLLENGNVTEAGTEKQRLEQMQRDRVKQEESNGRSIEPRWFLKTEENREEVYMYNGKYWECRKNPGFAHMTFPKLW